MAVYGISDRRLAYFVALAEHRSFARAAETSGVTQSALSQQIVKLETEIGAELIDRSVRPIALTEVGHRVYALALDILNGYREVSSVSDRVAAGTIGRVRVGIIPSLLYLGAIPAAVRAFRDAFPEVRLDLRRMPNVSAVDRLFDRHLDVIFSYSALEGKELRGVEVDRDRYVVALPADHQLAARAELRLVDLKDETFISFPRESYAESQDDIVYAARRRGFSPRTVTISATFIEQLGFVAARFGIAMMPSAITAHSIAGVVFVPLKESLSLVTRVYWRPEPADPAVQRFVNSIVASLAEGDATRS